MRKSIEVDGLHHAGNPIPAASRVGPMLVSSGINGMDSADGSIPNALEDQARLVFENIERIMAVAGGATTDIAKCTFFVRDKSSKADIDAHWNSMFPDEDSRPARHTLVYDHLPGPVLLQAEIVAYIQGANS